MHGKFDSRHPLVGLSDELIRLNGRLKSLFADARRNVGLGDSEMSVLNAVVEADHPPTVPQIGRSYGQPRQQVQRAANSLIEEGLIAAVPNPDHKRAVLLRPTDRGVALKRENDTRADALAAQLAQTVDVPTIKAATEALNTIRRQLETGLRGVNKGKN